MACSLVTNTAAPPGPVGGMSGAARWAAVGEETWRKTRGLEVRGTHGGVGGDDGVRDAVGEDGVGEDVVVEPRCEQAGFAQNFLNSRLAPWPSEGVAAVARDFTRVAVRTFPALQQHFSIFEI